MPAVTSAWKSKSCGRPMRSMNSSRTLWYMGWLQGRTGRRGQGGGADRRLGRVSGGGGGVGLEGEGAPAPVCAWVGWGGVGVSVGLSARGLTANAWPGSLCHALPPLRLRSHLTLMLNWPSSESVSAHTSPSQPERAWEAAIAWMRELQRRCGGAQGSSDGGAQGTGRVGVLGGQGAWGSACLCWMGHGVGFLAGSGATVSASGMIRTATWGLMDVLPVVLHVPPCTLRPSPARHCVPSSNAPCATTPCSLLPEPCSMTSAA